MKQEKERIDQLKKNKAEAKAKQQELMLESKACRDLCFHVEFTIYDLTLPLACSFFPAEQRKMAIRVEELQAQGVQFAQFKALQEFIAAEKDEGKKRKAAMSKHNSIAGSAATIAGQLENLEVDELPMVKIGDASVAAPFTSKIPSIRSCVDIVRQGRCTLVTSIQMYQILALNCLISAYSLSVLYLDGVRDVVCFV